MLIRLRPFALYAATYFCLCLFAMGQADDFDDNEKTNISGTTLDMTGHQFRLAASNAAGTIFSSPATLTVSPADEPLLVKGVTATATSELDENFWFRFASHAVDGIYCDTRFWESVGVGFVSAEDRDPAITFDLQSMRSLDHFMIWNSHEDGPAIKRMVVETSLDGTAFTAFSEVALDKAGACPSVPQKISLLGATARFVRFDILENHGGQVFPIVGNPTGNTFVAIDEVEFYSVAVPVSEIPQENLKLWLSAGKGITATQNGEVLEWRDQSSHGNHATSEALASAPRLVVNAINALPALRFDTGDAAGVNSDYLQVPNSASLQTAGDLTSFVVIKFSDYENYRAIWGKTAGNLPSAIDYYMEHQWAVPTLYRGNGTGFHYIQGSNAIPVDAFVVIGFEAAGKNVTHFYNGEISSTGQIDVEYLDNQQPIRIGARADNNPRLNGELAELIIYDVALPQGDRNKVISYLHEKYGIGYRKLRLKTPAPFNGGWNLSFFDAPPNSSISLEQATNADGPWEKVSTMTAERGTGQFISNSTTDRAFYRLLQE